MKLFGNIRNVENIVFDVDNTLWRQAREAEENQLECKLIAAKLGITVTALQDHITFSRGILKRVLQRPISTYEAMRWVGVSRHVLTECRCQAYEGQHRVGRNLALSNQFRLLAGEYRIVFATNSPMLIGERVLHTLGVRDYVSPDRAPLWCFENTGMFKPNPAFFDHIAKGMRWHNLSSCLSIGDSESKDCATPRSIGFGAAIQVVHAPDDVETLIGLLVNRDWSGIEQLCEPATC